MALRQIVRGYLRDILGKEDLNRTSFKVSCDGDHDFCAEYPKDVVEEESTQHN